MAAHKTRQQHNLVMQEQAQHHAHYNQPFSMASLQLLGYCIHYSFYIFSFNFHSNCRVQEMDADVPVNNWTWPLTQLHPEFLSPHLNSFPLRFVSFYRSSNPSCEFSTTDAGLLDRNNRICYSMGFA